MTSVVDASIASKWFFQETGSLAAIRVLESDEVLLAPDLLVAEVANVLWKKQRIGRMFRAEVERALAALPRRFAELTPAATLAARAFEIACDLDHPVYDCLYLALAEREEVHLVTADARLAAKLSGTPWARRLTMLEP